MFLCRHSRKISVWICRLSQENLLSRVWVDIIQSFEGLYRIKRQREDEISLCSWVGTSIFPALGHQSLCFFCPREVLRCPSCFSGLLPQTEKHYGLHCSPHLANGRLGDSLAITIWANSYISTYISISIYKMCIYISVYPTGSVSLENPD